MVMPRFSVAATFIALLAVAGGIIARQLKINADLTQALATGAAENRELRLQLRPAARGNPLPAVPAAPPARQTLPAHGPIPPSHAQEHEMDQLRASLAEAKAALGQLETQVSDLQAQIQHANQENSKLSAEAARLEEKQTEAARIADQAQAQLKTSQDTITQLEATNAKLRQANAAAVPQNLQTAQLVSELQEISRRREVYLNSIIRRYRELTEQYRAMTGVLDSRRDREGSPVSAVELSRIQSTIAMAEEDLRQIGSLNAQALRIERKLK
jgi:DNA repair exonuclease SbcCD ATPase subunit